MAYKQQNSPFKKKKTSKSITWHDSDAPDAKGKFKELSPSSLASWLIKTRKGKLNRIISSLNQQYVFNRGKQPSYAAKMKTTMNIVRKRLDKGDSPGKKRQDPLVGTGKKPKGSGRRLYTDENPKDTVSIKYATVEDARKTISKVKNINKPYARKIQILTVLEQRAKFGGKPEQSAMAKAAKKELKRNRNK